MSSLPKYQRFIGRLLTKTLVFSLSTSMMLGSFGFTTQDAHATTSEDVKQAKADLAEADGSLKEATRVLHERQDQLDRLNDSDDDSTDNRGCFSCRSGCAAGCADVFTADGSCVAIFHAKGDSLESIPPACAGPMMACGVVAKALKIKKLEKEIDAQEKKIKRMRSERDKLKTAYNDARGDCEDCALEAQKAQMKAMFREPSTGELIVAGIGAATPLLMGGLGAYMGIRGMNQYAGMYNNYLQSCSTMGIPCQSPGMGGMGMMGMGMPGMGMMGMLGGSAIVGGVLGGIPGMGMYGMGMPGMGMYGMGMPGMGMMGMLGGSAIVGGVLGGIPGMGMYGMGMPGMGMYGMGMPGMGMMGMLGGSAIVGGVLGGIPGMGMYGMGMPGMGMYGMGMPGMGMYGNSLIGGVIGGIGGGMPGMGMYGMGMYGMGMPGMGMYGMSMMGGTPFGGMGMTGLGYNGMMGMNGMLGMSGMGGWGSSGPLTGGWATPNMGWGSGFNSALFPNGNSQYNGLYGASMQYAMQMAQRQQSDLMLAQQQSWEAQQRLNQVMGSAYGYGNVGYGNIGGSFGGSMGGSFGVGLGGYMGTGVSTGTSF